MDIPPKTAWIPDWKDSTQYPAPNATSASLWAWEFLRRNPKYRLRWETLILPDMCNEDKSHVQKDFHVGDNLQLFEQEFGINNPPAPWLSSENLMNMQQYPLFIKAARVEMRPIGWPEGEEEPYIVESYLSATEALVRIDLRFPLPAQFQQAKHVLEARIKMLDEDGEVPTWRRNIPELYPSYLRLLDAEEQGASPIEMGNAIFSEVPNEYPNLKRKRMVEHGIKRANALRDDHYRFIAAAET
jgi:hypothetical protein